jgi:hypothetical protein
MNHILKDAAEVSLTILNEMDGYRLPQDMRVKHKALDQCLRSMIEILENESNKNTAQC